MTVISRWREDLVRAKEKQKWSLNLCSAIHQSKINKIWVKTSDHLLLKERGITITKTIYRLHQCKQENQSKVIHLRSPSTISQSSRSRERLMVIASGQRINLPRNVFHNLSLTVSWTKTCIHRPELNNTRPKDLQRWSKKKTYFSRTKFETWHTANLINWAKTMCRTRFSKYKSVLSKTIDRLPLQTSLVCNLWT